MAEVAVLVGLQASGKSTFYRRELAATHVHLSKDNWPRARRRERRQLAELERLLTEGRDVAVDNTNPSPAARAGVLAVARRHRATVVGYWFPPDLAASRRRNAARTGRARVPDVALHVTIARLTPPTRAEGFDVVYEVRLADGDFTLDPRET